MAALDPSSTDRHIRGETIRRLNDELRLHPRPGHAVLTVGVATHGAAFVTAALAALATFDAFDADNDPYGEHDFGALTIMDQRLFWKIDYYDRSLKGGSPAPWDDARTHRVLTLMLAEEY